MTLIPCPECRRAVSSAAFQCPGCGQPLRGDEVRPPRGRDRMLPLVIGGALLASVLGYAGVWMAATGFHAARGGEERVEVIRTVDVTHVVEPPPFPPIDEGWGPPTRLTVIDEIRPEIRNGAEVSRIIARVYPPGLRDAGIPGMAMVRFRVLEDGRPDMESLVVEHASTGAFGDAAPRVVSRMRFRPGTIDGRPAASWITMPISFDPSR